MTQSWFRPTVIMAVFTLAVILRVIGVMVNTEGNDDHNDVIRVMAFEHRIPADNELWEAFQPKLYHGTVAVILRVMPDLSRNGQIRIAQAVSCAAGIATLFILLSFIRSLPVAARVQQMTFALVALNPKMIATSIQATNDAFVILFVSLSLVAGYRFFQSFDRRPFISMTAAVLLGCIAKGNALVVAIAVGCTCMAAWIHSAALRRRIAGFAALLLVAGVLFVVPLGGHWTRFQEGRSVFATNMLPEPRPHFFEETIAARPGITSIAHGFLTFRLIDMLTDPRPIDLDDYPRHRTSFWSLLYGYAHSVHYDHWPPTWQAGGVGIRWLLNSILIIALIPTVVLILGIARGALWVAAQGMLWRSPPKEWSAEFLFAVTTFGYLGFVALYGFRYRDFGTMKAIFLFPSAVALVTYYSRELQRIATGSSRFVSTLVFGSSGLLCCLYVADIVALLTRLTAAALRAG